MKGSLEYSCEAFFISLFRADARLKGKNIVHFDDERKAKSDAIIVQAKQGGNNLAGSGGFDVEITVEYRAPIGTTKAKNDSVASALQQVVYNSTLDVHARARMATNAGLSQLLIKDESTGDRQNSENLRKRILTFPLQAKLA